MSHLDILFPHPIIRPNGFDYKKDCHFQMNIEQPKKHDGVIHIELSFDLSSSTVRDLIDNNKAKFFVNIQCSKTHQRITKDSTTDHIICDIPVSDCADKINITPYISTVEKILAFRSEEHVDEIKRMIPKGVDLPIGSILAVGSSYDIPIDSIEKIQAAIKIIPNGQLNPGTYTIDTNGEYINIVMHPSTRDEIHTIHDKSKGLLYSSLYVTAIEHAIRDLEDSKERKWAQALQKTLENHNIEINYDELKDEAHKHAQKILNKPLERLIQYHNGEDSFE